MNSNKLTYLRLVALFVAILLVAAPALLAQSAGTSGLTGTVTDPSGAAVPNVTVTVTSSNTNQARTATPGGDGVYRFTLLPPGNYKLRFSANAFNNAGQNNSQIDGVAINNIANCGSANDFGIYGGIGIPSPDALQEFRIQTSTYDASYGRNPGANINVVTKSGTNVWHGTGFEFFRNAQLNANDFFYNRDNPNSKTNKQVLNQNQFAAVLGGPTLKD